MQFYVTFALRYQALEPECRAARTSTRQRLADEYGVSIHTVARWIAKCREDLELLTPTSAGKRGATLRGPVARQAAVTAAKASGRKTPTR